MDTAQQTAEAAQESIDNMEIGGRNLIWGTLTPDITQGSRPSINGLHYTGTDSMGELVGSSGTWTAVTHGVKITNTGATRTYLRFGTTSTTAGIMMGLTAGETYTFSCDAEYKLLSGTQTASTYKTRAVLYHKTAAATKYTTGTVADGTMYILGEYPQSLKGTVMTKRVEWTFTIPDTAEMIYIFIGNERTTASNYAAGDYISLSNIKLEKGDKATDWQAAPEDYEQNISNAQQQATEAQEQATEAQELAATALQNVDTLGQSTTTQISVLNNAISQRVTTTQYNADQERVTTALTSMEATTDDLSLSVQNLQNGVGTHFIVEANMIRITQDHEKRCEQQLTADQMRFVDLNGNVVASFGASGGYADRLWSNETLSVGTTTEGWYDITTMTGGIADKWRSGQDPLPALIITQPVNCYVDTTEQSPRVEFSVVAENATGYQWKVRANGSGDWTPVSGAESADFSAVYISSALSDEYCCEITGDDTNKIMTEPRKVYAIGMPEILVQPVASTTVNVGETVRLTFLACGGASYSWYHKNGSSWVLDQTTATPVFETQELAELTKTYHCVVTNSVGSVTTDEFVITWE